MMLDELGFPVLLALLALAGLATSLSRLPGEVKALLYAALALRLAGALGRYYMVMVLYGGTGDSLMYFDYGTRYAERFWALDFSPLWDESYWHGTRWWGTQFIRHVSGFVFSFVGPTLLGGYLAFSLLAFLGLIGFGIAFRRAYPEVPVGNYLRWVWLFPSLWFWPSAVGKEAILLLGMGLAMWGFVGRNERINWILLAVGMFFVFAVRVQVAAVLIVSMVLAQWLSLGGRWTLGRVVQGVLILGVGLGAINLATQSLGMDGLHAEGVQTYLEDNAGRGGDTRGEVRGSAIGETTISLAGVPMALVNILVRPFPWEASNVQLLLASLEVVAFWVIVWYRRRRFAAVLRHWRSDRLLRVAVPFILVYAVTLGMLMANMGIIARQRIFIFPFLFLLVEAVPRAVQRAGRLRAAAVSAPRRVPPPGAAVPVPLGSAPARPSSGWPRPS